MLSIMLANVQQNVPSDVETIWLMTERGLVEIHVQPMGPSIKLAGNNMPLTNKHMLQVIQDLSKEVGNLERIVSNLNITVENLRFENRSLKEKRLNVEDIMIRFEKVLALESNLASLCLLHRKFGHTNLAESKNMIQSSEYYKLLVSKKVSNQND